MRADPAAGSAPARASARACGPPAARPTIRAGGRRSGRRRTAIFEDAVLRAMAKWSDVPAVFGWLGLDRRGRWRLEGELIGNEMANRFIDRTYARDTTGRWSFHNGPQRAFVTLEYAPFVYRLDDAGTRTAHTSRNVRGEGTFPEEGQNLTVVTDLGPGSWTARRWTTTPFQRRGGQLPPRRASGRALHDLRGAALSARLRRCASRRRRTHLADPDPRHPDGPCRLRPRAILAERPGPSC